jgi:CheY-like chemotaxis protein
MVKMKCGRDEKVGWTILVASKDESVQTLVADSLQDGQNTILFVHSVKAFFEKLIEGGVNLIIYDPDLHPMDTMSAFQLQKFITLIYRPY